MQRNFIVLVMLLSLTAAVMSSPKDPKCPLLCSIDSDCCEAGGCHLGRCVPCRYIGVTCQSDSQCCDRGGCYVNKCVECRTINVSCQSDSQCCSGNCGSILGRCAP